MSQKLQPVRGTHDILPEESRKRRALFQALSQVAECYGYGEIATPIFEFSDVFHRTLGDSSDVVTKETYTFTDRGGESLTLRPEFTASVVRAFISNGLQEQLPFKVYYHGPAFRYERPQKGRLRQFHQFGAEILGAADPLADVEMIALAAGCLEVLGLKDKVTLELNSLGDADSRSAYRQALVGYFNGHKADLSDESKARLEKNPLRILDSKQEQDRKLVAEAPVLKDYFTPEAADFFGATQESLQTLGLDFRVNSRLVRGLDYYAHTVFEFTTDALGAQGTVLAGGRYDGLVKLMGGGDIPGVGFAAGVERLLALMDVAASFEFPKGARPVVVVPIGEAEEQPALQLTQELRHAGVTTELVVRGNMSKKMKRADKLGASLVLMLGETEVQSGMVTVKQLDSGVQQQVARSELHRFLESYK